MLSILHAGPAGQTDKQNFVNQLRHARLNRMRATGSQRTGIINQIRAFLLERRIAVHQTLRFRWAELPGILAKHTDALSPRTLRIIEDRRLAPAR